MMKLAGPKLLTVLMLGGGLLILALLFLLKPEPESDPSEVAAPVVRVERASPTSATLDVTSQGSVTPEQEIDLVSEVSGKVVRLAPNFTEGGFFKRGDVLVTIDARDYQNRVTVAEAAVAQARQVLAREEAEAEQARIDLEELSPDVQPTELALRKPQLAQARASLDAALADLEIAKLGLERTRVRAPFDGRVRTRAAGVGQYVAPGTSLGQIFSTDTARVRLPLTDRQLRYVDLALGRADGKPLPVTLTGSVGGVSHSWKGDIVRTEGVIDEQSRVLFAVAEVADPYGLSSSREVPLPMGLFVQASIPGRTYENVFILPRAALVDGDQVMVVDGNSQLHFRTVEVLRAREDGVVIQSGLEAGDRVVVSPIESAAEGMEVEVAGEVASPGGSSGGGGAPAGPLGVRN